MGRDTAGQGGKERKVSVVGYCKVTVPFGSCVERERACAVEGNLFVHLSSEAAKDLRQGTGTRTQNRKILRDFHRTSLHQSRTVLTQGSVSPARGFSDWYSWYVKLPPLGDSCELVSACVFDQARGKCYRHEGFFFGLVVVMRCRGPRTFWCFASVEAMFDCQGTDLRSSSAALAGGSLTALRQLEVEAVCLGCGQGQLAWTVLVPVGWAASQDSGWGI